MYLHSQEMKEDKPNEKNPEGITLYYEFQSLKCVHLKV